MKKISASLVILSLLLLQTAFAAVSSSPTVREQLEALNKSWISQDLNYPVLKERTPLTNDVALIQMHLSLVEQTLRSNSNAALSPEQKMNREKCLDILHDYWNRGIFPKNLYHSTRTPYFIDKFGTACAVGQLIISTGHAGFANKVKEENNNAYISELDKEYPEISAWANKYGFTLEELAWIQPCYCSPSGPGIVHVSCYGGYDGYFVPTPSGGVAPYSYVGWYRWNGSSWDMLFCGGCDLIAGDYKCTVSDAMGTQTDYFATINQPPAISLSVTSTDDLGSCNGTAAVVASDGTPGYTYSWTPGGYTTPSLTNLCPGTYTVTVVDNNGCVSLETVQISLATSIKETSTSSVTVFPNPVSKEINLKLNTFFNPNQTLISIYNATGKLIIQKKPASIEVSIDLSELAKGVYLLRIDNGKTIETHQFVKNE
jgi:hypothetical protein